MPETAEKPRHEPADIQIRLADDADTETLSRLFEEGRVEGQVRVDDKGEDLADVRHFYLNDHGRSAFWVATLEDQVVGMVGVLRLTDDSAEVRRLRVDSRHRRQGVGTRLMEKALGFCQEHGYLKVVLDVRIERGPAISMFEKFGFMHARTREVDGRKLLDFYLDLYREPGSA